MPARSANTRTACQFASTKPALLENFFSINSKNYEGAQVRVLAVVLAMALPLLMVCSGAAQTVKKKSHRPKAAACRAGCKPETTAPDVATSSTEDASTQKELEDLARNLHNAAPGGYEKLSGFANKHSADIYGSRAALALGYDDYHKNRAPQALSWFAKAQNDELLREYVIFWTAQTKRTMKRNGEALAEFSTVLHDYPNTAIKEEVVDALAVTATETGHAQDAIAALTAYSGTTGKPALLLDRAHAYQSAGQAVRAVKDYQAIYYKFALSDEAKSAGAAVAAPRKKLRWGFSKGNAGGEEESRPGVFDAPKKRGARAAVCR